MFSQVAERHAESIVQLELVPNSRQAFPRDARRLGRPFHLAVGAAEMDEKQRRRFRA
jgi:hypothetical protein